jgi:hypothetical protein
MFSSRPSHIFSTVAGYNSFSAGSGERKVGRLGLHREEDLDLDFSSALEA